MAGRWVDYLTASWNPGERSLHDIVPIGIDLHRGKAGEDGRVAVMHWMETADLIKRGLAEQLERAGFPCIMAPARTPDGRKLMLSYDPTQVAPLDNGFRNEGQPGPDWRLQHGTRSPADEAPDAL
jgi:hypothetical protein